MKILVTGAGGFVGRHLVPKLREKGHDVVSPSSSQCDLREPGSLARLGKDRFDRIYHLAAWTQAGTFCDLRRGEQWIVNHQINTNLLAWWHEHQPQAGLIALGTSASYPEALPLVETNYLEGAPADAYLAYAYSKRSLLVGLQSLARQFGRRYLYVVPSTLYGPHYPLDGRQLHFIYDVIRKILAARASGGDIVLWGDGHQRRELVYVDDFVSILLQLAEAAENEVINVGAGESHTIREFAQLICRIVDYPFEKIVFDPKAFTGVRSKCLDISKLQALLPARSLTALEDGLRHTVAWMSGAARGDASPS